MFRHILPNIGPLVIVVASTTLPAAILAESALTFLGVGLPLGGLVLAGKLAVALAEAFSVGAALLLDLAGGLAWRVVAVASGGLLETFVATLWTLTYRDLGGLGLTGAEEA